MKKLRPYQIEDVDFLSKRTRSGCFNEQRTGKTPIALKTFEKQGLKKILIICPASAVYQWAEEYEAWLNRPCIPFIGTPAQRKQLLNTWTDGLAISYGLFKDTQRYTGFSQLILKQKPDGVILDEAHRIKNSTTAITKAVFKCTCIPYRMALTGTPAHNKAHEIFNILKWLYPDTFSSRWKFLEYFFKITTKYNASGVPFKEPGDFLPGKQQELLRTLNNISTQRKRIDVMPWLPQKDYQQVKLPCTPQQKKYLKELETYFETEHILTQGILDRLIRMRQICLHPALLNLKGDSPKLNWIKDYLNDYPDRPTIIFSKFTSFIKILSQELPNIKKGVIIGETPIKERNSLKNAFQQGDLNLLILNMDVGKEALTLDRAEVAIFTDKYPPIGDIQQAEDRFITTTKEHMDKPHLIIELMMKDTYDEQLYQLIQQRKTETDIINDYHRYLKREHS